MSYKLPPWPTGDAYPDRATAEAYAKESPKLRPSLDGQRIKLAREWLVPQKCPNCLQPMPVVDATHLGGDNFMCSHCEAKLVFGVPIISVGPAYWSWSLAPHQIPTKKEESDVPAGSS